MSCDNLQDEWAAKDAALQRLCNDHESRLKLVPSPFWTAEIYGFGLQISKYGFYPYCLPLCIYTDHGPGYRDAIPIHEIESGAPTQLYHSQTSASLWQRVTAKKAYCLYSPFAFYRRRTGVSLAPDVKGTIAFPAHSTPSIDEVGGFAKYIEQLKQLPERYHPITICMHMHDIRKGTHMDFIREGFEVVTAGNTLDQRFIERFYEIISSHKYATSNTPGSYLYYCVEMGLPFFVYGDKPKYINHSDRNLAIGVYDTFGTGYTKEVYDLFYLPNPEAVFPRISPQQKEFVESHMGIRDGIPRTKMALVLYWALIRYFLTARGFAFVRENNIFTRMLKRAFFRGNAPLN